MTSPRRPPTIGLNLWPQDGTWAELRGAAVAADHVGVDPLWTWDHLYAIQGEPDRPIFEGWTTIAAWAALTERIELGLLVAANTFRDPGLTAKAALTVELGVSLVLADMPAPYDRETIERCAEVRALLGDA